MSLTDQKNSLFGKAAKPGVRPAPSAAPVVDTKPKPTIKAAAIDFSIGLNGPQKAKKIEEAKTLSAKASKFLETSVFKWKPDHLAAAPLFENAANCYKAAADFVNAKLLYEEAAKSHEQCDSFAAMAGAFIKTAEMCKVEQSFRLHLLFRSTSPDAITPQPQQVIGNAAETAEFYKKASYAWGMYGDTSKCAEFLIKAAKEVEDVSVAEAKELYKKGVFACMCALGPVSLTSSFFLCFIFLFLLSTLQG